MLTMAVTAPAATQPRRLPGAGMRSEQNEALDRVKRGEIRPLNEIEGRIVPRMRGADYLGPELDDDRYRLKFMRNGSVIWVDVDARTGQIIGRTGQ
ncbi:MAG: hypothetical protein EOP60_19600 [Sphingomonadales bacterium]|nr:MAG: hypothetical protein EOP60_19600 [Sphingomonadales bacterium]